MADTELIHTGHEMGIQHEWDAIPLQGAMQMHSYRGNLGHVFEKWRETGPSGNPHGHGENMQNSAQAVIHNHDQTRNPGAVRPPHYLLYHPKKQTYFFIVFNKPKAF